MLHNEGRLYVEVPNAGAPHAAPGKMFHFAHIYNFTADTLEMLAEKSHFRVQQWLSGPTDKNLRVLLACRCEAVWRVKPASYRRTIESITSFNTWTYHLRWSYVRQRMRTLISHPYHHILADRRARRILAFCRTQPAAS
jgi:hypothetical protein